VKYITFPKFSFFIPMLIFFLNIEANGQDVIIKGVVKNESGEPVPFASVVFEDTNIGTLTDDDGYFSLNIKSSRSEKIYVQSIGYITAIIQIHKALLEKDFLEVTLKSSEYALDEVVVSGKSNAQHKMEKPIKVEAIDISKLQAQSTAIPQIINQTAGVKVRQSAGVGSGTSININGLQGRAIRFFRDDIPLDYLGNAYELSLVPIGQLSGIDIYKGVLPARLGADALGGAVNLITRDFKKNQVDLSYSYGSFNTHQANLGGYWEIPGTDYFIQLTSYYVYTDNDYRMDVKVTDPETRTLKPANVRRFHNAVRSGFLEAKTGIKNTNAADLFEIGYAGFTMHKEDQHGFNINNPFGEVWNEESFNAFTTRYKKELGSLNIDMFGAYSKKSTLAVDTSSRRYNWFGNINTTGWTNGGETDGANKTLRNLNYDHFVGRVFFSYKIGGSTLSFNHNLVTQRRTGSDPLGSRVEINNNIIDPFSVPAEYLKNVSGLQLTSELFKEKLTHLITVKRYDVTTSSLSLTSFEDLTPELASTSYGVGSSMKYSFSENRFVRLSYEKSTRIPEAIEYFGDGLFIVGNNDLKPERSHNVNFGFYTHIDKKETVFWDINAFYRNVNNQIILQPIWTLIHSQYQNKDVAEIKGVETKLKAHLFNRIKTNLGITFQDVRRININDRAEQSAEGSRIRYIPYFFTNLLVHYDHAHLIKQGDLASIYINHSFVEKYPYLMIPKNQELAIFEPVSNSPITNMEDQIIPSQHIIDMGFIYKWHNLPLWINIEINNILNTKSFDNYRIPKPPRNFKIKIRYVIS